MEGADWADSFIALRHGPAPAAADMAGRMLGNPPAWAQALLSLRDTLVRPFGLKTAATADPNAVNGFPLLRSDGGIAVLGLDDTHLDFRIVVTVTARGAAGFALRITTLVRRHGLAGRLYLAAVLPAHRLIVPAILNRV